MSRRPPFDRRLLGGLTPERFLAKHWQRRPLLVRGAVADPGALPGRAALAALAMRDDVESRLVTAFDGAWTLEQGPFDRLPRQKRDWTLLVQGVNLYDAAADALMRRFDFVSAMRLDDLMISHAVDGGGVGPHLDSYDVFLLQVEGRRRWRWSAPVASIDAEAWIEGLPLKQLRHFAPDDEAVLEPGDLLYLPPACAHEGVALGSCTTASIGFRAPSWNALTQEFLFAMAERSWPDGRYGDAGRQRTGSPGALDAAMLSAIERRLSRVRWNARDVEAFVGRHFSEPKPHVVFERPEPMSSAAFARRAAAAGLALDRRTTLLYRGTRGYIAGESFALPAAGRAAFRRLADRRAAAPDTVASMVVDPDTRALLHAWWGDGWIRFDDRSADGPP